MSGVGLTGKAVPLNGGNFPVWEDVYGQGGYRTLPTIAARNTLLAAPLFLKAGMLVYCEDVQCIYLLSPDRASCPRRCP